MGPWQLAIVVCISISYWFYFLQPKNKGCALCSEHVRLTCSFVMCQYYWSTVPPSCANSIVVPNNKKIYFLNYKRGKFGMHCLVIKGQCQYIGAAIIGYISSTLIKLILICAQPTHIQCA